MNTPNEKTDTTQPFSDSNPQFTLYSHHTGPNGFKVAQVLSELGLTYRTILLEFGSGPGGMKTAEYESINPNGRIPSIVDHGSGDLIVWESGAIITYVCKKYDKEYKLWAESYEDQAKIETWLFYQVSGQGPYIGQAMWFQYYHSEIVPSAQERYRAETRRVLGILERELKKPDNNGWLVLGRITAADVSFYHWYLHAHRILIDIPTEFLVVADWLERMKARPGIKKGSEGSRIPEGGTILRN
ncbi:Transcriptional regulator ure2 [Rhizina undulata]